MDLIRILGDRPEAYDHIGGVDGDELDSMRRNWDGTDAEREYRILDLRVTYDWPALKSVVRVCPGITTGRFQLNDLFNLLDMHIPSGFGFPVPRGGPSASSQDLRFLDSRRLIGAKNALLLILLTMFYVDWQVCVETKKDKLEQYKGFAMLMGRRMQRQGMQLAGEGVFHLRDFYQGDVSFVSMNYDPILLWVQFIAHRELNKSPSVPHVGSPPVPLHIYNDFGHLIPSRSIERPEADYSWYPMNEAAVQRLNEVKSGGGAKVRLTKILFPHGSLCWRGCPNCGKLSAYHADQWDLFAPDLFPPPPLRAFDTYGCPRRIGHREKTERKKGRVDARTCLHCGQLTYARHTQAIMQSSFKARPPSFIEEIQRDLQAVTMRAKHVIFMGYSLPPDDFAYRAFFAARSQRAEPGTVRCTIVNWKESYRGWYGPDELKTGELAKDEVVKAAQDVFGFENVRFLWWRSAGGVSRQRCRQPGEAGKTSYVAVG